MRARRNPWLRLAFDAWALSVEASTVMVLRSVKIAAGGAAANAEVALMIKEKVEAGIALQMMAMTGDLGPTAAGASARTVNLYRQKVRANRRRLGKR